MPMLKQLLQSKFARNVILVASGTAGAQAITMAFSPIITRFYGPEAFGLLGTFTAILGIVMPIAALSYPIAIVLPKSDDDAKAIAKLSFRIAFVIALILSAILLIAGNEIAALLGMEAIASFMLLIPIAMFFNALQQIMQQWLIRKKQFKVTARIAISQSLILNSSKVGVGFFYPFGSVLIVLSTLGNALYAAQLWFGAKKWADQDGRIDKATKTVSLKEAAYKHRDFAYYRTPQVLVNAVSQSIPVLLLASFFGPAVAGFFSLGKSVLSAPASLIGTSVGNVFYPKIAEAYNAGKNPIPFLNKATLATFLVGLIPFAIIMVFGVWVFEFVFGDEWTVAGQYAQWMALWVLISLAARPLIATIPVIKIQGVFLIYEIVFLTLKAVALIVAGYVYKDALLAVAVYSLITASSYLVLYMITLSLIKARVNIHNERYNRRN
ncbi:oligosaccharide flippase family protein [Ignatzschineria indica]|uniref:lipopolysaccharide biosynthesis protein n=1 Tax=Ignatzschineria indica TaxID=472583 RepID=UPI002574E14C|nr:oligosaccharide flippase family protein [Ignatzschineria indica]MDM1545265.1 oligosaccharide flippase family protein [Ignatzschineria indica]